MDLDPRLVVVVDGRFVANHYPGGVVKLAPTVAE